MLIHLSWRRSSDSLDLALACNRLAARGVPIWWLGAPGPAHEGGDYLCEGTAETMARMARFGVPTVPWEGKLPDGALPLAYPRIALLAGMAAPYPHFAYYALALARLGFAFELVDGAAVAGGALSRYDLLILPGGFALWGLDNVEGVPGADAAIRDFLAGGGAAIGSGGGAFYLSAGRPGWTGTVWARPRHTQEYLSTGVGIVRLRLGADSVAFGCPPTLSMPYYHGPVYDEMDRSVSAAATFDSLLMPGRLFVDNPLENAVFGREMKGGGAILRGDGRRGRAVLFSPSPEMGDLIRKYIAVESYVSRYLPICGADIMISTLRNYRVLDSPSFRLVLNAIHSLMLRKTHPHPPPSLPVEPVSAATGDLLETMDKRLAVLKIDRGEARGAVLEMLRADLVAQLAGLRPRLAAAEATLLPLPGQGAVIRRVWAACQNAACQNAAGQNAAGEMERSGGGAARAIERLADTETALGLGEAWCRLAEAEAHFCGLG